MPRGWDALLSEFAPGESRRARSVVERATLAIGHSQQRALRDKSERCEPIS
jgi:hypothetical protein